jgi:hypothetical protein
VPTTKRISGTLHSITRRIFSEHAHQSRFPRRKLDATLHLSDAENKFSSSEQTLDGLIAAMETAKVLASVHVSCDHAPWVLPSGEEQGRALSASATTAHGCSTRTHCGW